MLMKAFIGKRYEVIRAHDGQEAIDLFPKVRPDLVFMDIKMPVVDGYEATRAIRKISKEVPILAITAFAFESDREKALEAGCTDSPHQADLTRLAEPEADPVSGRVAGRDFTGIYPVPMFCPGERKYGPRNGLGRGAGQRIERRSCMGINGRVLFRQ
ncbi:MAG: response regulator [Alistipes indistinctus]